MRSPAVDRGKKRQSGNQERFIYHQYTTRDMNSGHSETEYSSQVMIPHKELSNLHCTSSEVKAQALYGTTL